MYEMWSTERFTLQTVIENIFKKNYLKTDQVVITDVVVPEKAKKQFTEREQAKMDIIQKISSLLQKKTSLNQELEENKKLSKSEIAEIKNQIEELNTESKLLREKGKLITFELDL